jgi:ribonuclease HII
MHNEPQLLNYLHKDLIEAGCDEAGRGPLAGPVFAAAVILPADFHHPLLNDSKKMTEKARELLRPIIEREAVAWAVEEVSAEEIDTINILNASITGMQRAVRRLAVKPEFLLIDGNRFKPFDGYRYQCIVKGDARFAPIAAASVLAKVTRDMLMEEAALEYPGYGFEIHKGYGTRAHYDALRELGASKIHRMTFLKKFYGEK